MCLRISGNVDNFMELLKHSHKTFLVTMVKAITEKLTKNIAVFF